jgi:uncharacterized protein
MTVQFVDTHYLLALVNSRDRHHAAAIRLSQGKARLVTTTWVVPPSREQFDRALVRYEQRPDKEWSLTDCLSFLLMEERGICEAMTADHHFEQAGFRALMRSE